MSDNLFERLTDLSIGTGSQTPLAAIARIKELEVKLRQLTETGKTQTNPADLGAGLPNSVNDTAP